MDIEKRPPEKYKEFWEIGENSSVNFNGRTTTIRVLFEALREFLNLEFAN